jgi:lipopolysaccharide transport system permease protein
MSSTTVYRRRGLVYLRDLVRELVARDMKLRYKRSVLGFAWSLLNPLAQLLVLNFVFRRVLPLDIPNYTSFLFSGILVWNWFSSSLYSATGAIVDNRDLIRRPGFPPGVLPVVSIASNFIHFLLALPILLLFLVLSGIPLTPTLFFLPVLFAIQFVLTLSFAYLVAALHVSFRDTQYLLGIALLLGFYLSPVFYDVAAIPVRYRSLYYLNPMVLIIDSYRAVLMRGELPDARGLLLLTGAAMILFWLGRQVFDRSSRHFVEEL